MYFDWQKVIYVYEVQLFLLFYNFCARPRLWKLRYNNRTDLYGGWCRNSNVFKMYINNIACSLGTRALLGVGIC